MVPLNSISIGQHSNIWHTHCFTYTHPVFSFHAIYSSSIQFSCYLSIVPFQLLTTPHLLYCRDFCSWQIFGTQIQYTWNLDNYVKPHWTLNLEPDTSNIIENGRGNSKQHINQKAAAPLSKKKTTSKPYKVNASYMYSIPYQHRALISKCKCLDSGLKIKFSSLNHKTIWQVAIFIIW